MKLTDSIPLEGPPSYDGSIGNEVLRPSQNTRSTYEYSALSYPDSIRVFVLEPSADETSRLEGKLVEQRLSDASCTEQGYNALSYVWGEQKDVVVTHLEGRQLCIGQNLDSALRHIRRKDIPIRLWVDALCIDQASVNERNHQVQQMRRIYSSAAETIIYLGDMKGGNIELSAWNFLERRATWAMNENRDKDADLPGRREELIYFRGELADVEIEVLERPWFKRLWVFQEVVVSRSLSIQCGTRRIPWDDFCKVLLHSPTHHDRYGFSFELLRKVDIVRDMFQARCSYQELQGMSHTVPHWRSEVQDHKHTMLHVLDLLQMARTLQASDPRDKIFGLLGICSGIDPDDQEFAIDYSQPHRTVYTNFARGLINATRSYDVLSFIDHNDLTEYEDDLPSWVPNWDLSERGGLVQRKIISTLDPVNEHSTPATELCRWEGDFLVATGSVLGRISLVSDTIELRRNDEMKFQEIRDSGQSDEEKWHGIIALWELTIKPYTISDEPPAISDELHECIDARNFSKKGTVEHHLLARARKTASWSSDGESLKRAAIDGASIVDGRRIAIYKSATDPSVRGLAIVPAKAMYGDYLIDLRGGRVPFTVRDIRVARIEGDDMSSEAPDPLVCNLMGESLVNPATTDVSKSREGVFVID